MKELAPAEPFPDELFYHIFEIEDMVDRTQYIEAMKNRARQMKRANELNNLLKAFFMDYSQDEG